MRDTFLDLRGGHCCNRPLLAGDTWKSHTPQVTYAFECVPSDLPGALPKTFEVLQQCEEPEKSTLRYE